jgi:hypothetical protein
MQPTPSVRISRRSLGLGVGAFIALVSTTALAASAVYDFSSLAAGSTYHVGDIVNAADATIELTQFQWDDGTTWTAGGVATVVSSTNAAGSATKELNLNNIMVRVIPDTPAVSARLKYAWFGGNVNLGVNGDHHNELEPMDLDGIVAGGCDITVTQVNIMGGYRGVITITPQAGNDIERFGVGGQEFYVDDVRHDW